MHRMRTKVFSIANQKGGVGKTTTAINLSVALAKQKIKTLLIDLDPQGNATSGLGYERKEGGSLYPVFHEETSIQEQITPTDEKNLSLIPSEMDIAAIEIELAQKENYLIQLKNCLKPIIESGEFTAIVLDCPPALGMISMNCLTAADYLVITMQCEYLALEGLSQILRVVEELKAAGANPDLEIGGILMTMFDIRTNLSRQVVEEVKSHFENYIFKTVIPRSIRLSEAPSFGKSIFAYDPYSPGAVAYKNFASELIQRFKLGK